MKFLILDTSSRYLSLAVAQNDQVLRRIHRPLDRKHSLRLVPMIKNILARARLSLKQIDALCVSKGPGSFTGLRVGITTIKGLAFALSKPVIAIPSLDILVQNVNLAFARKDGVNRICVLVDARQNKVYTCLYQLTNGKISRKSEYLLMPLSELLMKLKGKIVFLGDGIRIYAGQIRNNKKIKPVFVEERFWYPRAAQAVPLVRARFNKGNFDDVNSLTPLYLYPKECQVK